MRSIALIFSVLITSFALITCSSGGDGDKAPSSFTSIPANNSGALKDPIDGDEIKPYHFDDTGSEVEIPTANAPVPTDSTEALNFAPDRTFFVLLGDECVEIVKRRTATFFKKVLQFLHEPL